MAHLPKATASVIARLVFGLTFFMVACGNSGGPAFVRGNNNLGTNLVAICPAVELKDPPMIYPANGATGVPTSIGIIYFSGSASVYSQAEVELTASPGGAITLGGPLVAAPTPLPSNVPGSGDVSEASVPTLNPETTYIVSLASSPCPLYGGTAGSFTTQ